MNLDPRTWHRGAQFGVPIVAVLALATYGQISTRNDTDYTPSRRLTAVETACSMLNDGDEPGFVYEVMKDLIADHPYTFGEDEATAARLAVNAAVQQGCG